MGFANKVAENKMVAEKCLGLKAYNAGVTRAYYSAFLHIKSYLLKNKFDYKKFLSQHKPKDRKFSHGTLRAAVIKCLLANGKNPTDVYKLRVIGSLYEKRRVADYEHINIMESELKISLDDLNTVLLIVS